MAADTNTPQYWPSHSNRNNVIIPATAEIFLNARHGHRWTSRSSTVPHASAAGHDQPSQILSGSRRRPRRPILLGVLLSEYYYLGLGANGNRYGRTARSTSTDIAMIARRSLHQDPTPTLAALRLRRPHVIFIARCPHGMPLARRRRVAHSIRPSDRQRCNDDPQPLECRNNLASTHHQSSLQREEEAPIIPQG